MKLRAIQIVPHADNCTCEQWWLPRTEFQRRDRLGRYSERLNAKHFLVLACNRVGCPAEAIIDAFDVVGAIDIVATKGRGR